ncbi:DUF4184 family protein [Curtobacterium pusillum]|uniref:DUF4184 family protein n=1 Tax=Curtobacterium pusillum TaxID=69373 RepID=UPI0016437D88|nr:DUF4184 family protein [Curtobacterium pusillum]
MPFTVSHTVVALAARRTPLPVAAVAVGAMAPDAVLFAPFLPPYTFTHSWTGVVTIDPVVALVVLAVWWWLVRPAWAGAVPGVRARLPEDWGRRPRWSLRGAVAVIVACLVGIATHVVWDAFSHDAGWGVRAVPALRDDVVPGYPWWALVQDLSSVLGLVALLVAAIVWWRRRAPRAVAPLGRASLVVVTVAGAVVVLVVLVVAARVLVAGRGVGLVVEDLAFRVPPTVAVVLVVGAVVLLLVGRRRSRD